MAHNPADETDRDPVEVLTEEFLERHRKGQYPSISEYTHRYPNLAEQIEALFPAAAALEELKQQRQFRPLDRSAVPPDRLGDYRIIREIGRGGMGIVYEAEQQSLERHVALKVLPEQYFGAPKQIERFRRESQTAARLHHSNIVPVFGVGSQGHLHYYVMQYIPGRGLDEILAHLRRLAGHEPLGPDAESEAADSSTTVTRISLAAATHALLDGSLRAQAPLPDSDDPSNEGPSGSSDSAGDPGEGEVGEGEVGEADLSPNSSPDSTPDPARADTDRVSQTIQVQPADLPTPAPSPPVPPSLSRQPPYWHSVARLGMQVAEALHYAHDQGVYHRDIKPGNLLLDAHGTVWITDFGLAKAVAHDNLSRSGDIIGTLRYMAPEQFDGRADHRSDVYSLGLTLYELLTLQPAFQEEERSRLIQQVLSGEIVPPRKLYPNIPRDLETIILKALSRNPEHRYPAAAQMADDLRCFLEDRPITARRAHLLERAWRWSRRNPTVSSLSLAVILLVIVGFMSVTWQWRKAKLESIRAEANMSLALDSMDEIFTQFGSSWMARPAETDEEQPELLPFAVSEGAADILQRALTFYDRFAQQNATNPRLRQDTAKAHRRIGDINQRLGRLPEAEQAYHKAIVEYEELAADFPLTDAWQREAATSYGELGMVLQLAGQENEAQQAYFTSLERLESLSQEFPHSRETKIELARSHNTIGTMLWRSLKASERDAHHVQALELLEELAESEPANPEYRYLQAMCYRSLSYRRRHPPVTDARQRAIDILDQLVADYPSVPDYRCELSEILSTHRFSGGRGRREPRDPEGAERIEAQFRRALQLASGLAQQFPSIPRYQAAHARALRSLASWFQFQRNAEKREEAEEHFRAAVQISESLVKNFPAIPYYRFQLGMAHRNLAGNLESQDRKAEAIEAYQAAIREQERNRRADPENRFVQRFLAGNYGQLARLLRQTGDVVRAEEAEQTARELRGNDPESDGDRGRRRRNNRYDERNKGPGERSDGPNREA